MIDRKDFIIAILTSFMLAVVLYPQITSSTSEYDPWLDINDDGKIRVDDILSVALAYGSDGDSTKNVTVTNFPLDEEGNLKVSIAEEPLKIYEGAVEITVLSLTNHRSVTGDPNVYKDFGMDFGDRSPEVDFPFLFSLKRSCVENINITSLWVSIGVTSQEGTCQIIEFDITINNNITIQTGGWNICSQNIHYRTFYFGNNTALQTIEQGINLLRLSNLIQTYGLSVHKIVVFIEYECQA